MPDRSSRRPRNWSSSAVSSSGSSARCRLDRWRRPRSGSSFWRFIVWIIRQMPSGSADGEGRSLSDPSPVIHLMPSGHPLAGHPPVIPSRRPRNWSSSGRHPLDAVSDLPEGFGTGHRPDAVWMPFQIFQMALELVILLAVILWIIRRMPSGCRLDRWRRPRNWSSF